MALAGAAVLAIRLWEARRPAPPPSATSPLSLSVERVADHQFLLKWNPYASAISGARRAVLHIEDGEHREDVELDAGQLRAGGIVYEAITRDVTFRLEVISYSGRPVSGAARTLSSTPCPYRSTVMNAATPPLKHLRPADDPGS